MPKVIRLNDPTSHGGQVVSVTATWFTVDGIAVARVGDLCSCPIPGHAACTVAEGDPHPPSTVSQLPTMAIKPAAAQRCNRPSATSATAKPAAAGQTFVHGKV